MGDTQSKPQDAWIVVLKRENRVVLQNPKNCERIDRRVLPFSDRFQLGAEKARFDQRLNHPCSVMRVLALQQQFQKLPCSNVCFLTVTFEYAQFVAKELFSLGEQKSLYILHQALKGFKFLYEEQASAFLVSRGMIFINNEEEVKVWLNEDITKNAISYHTRRLTQPEMVMSVLHAVQGSTVGQAFSPQFIKYFESFTRGVPSFDSGIVAIQEFALRSTSEEKAFFMHPPYQFSTYTKRDESMPTVSVGRRRGDYLVGPGPERTALKPVQLQSIFLKYQGV